MGNSMSTGGASNPSPPGKTEKPKPCCVCQDEKAKRDECMLMASDPEVECKPMVTQYKECMAGYGFKI